MPSMDTRHKIYDELNRLFFDLGLVDSLDADEPEHDCMDNAVPVQTGGPIGHGYACGVCGYFLQAG